MDNLINQKDMINGTIIWYYHLCKRACWLMSREILPYQDNIFLELGRIIHRYAYKREKKEFLIDNKIKIDIVKTGDIVIEVKKSSWNIESTRKQLLYYLYYIKKFKGIEKKGYIVIPEERKREEVRLGDNDIEEIEEELKDIEKLLKEPEPPPAEWRSFCSVCAYEEICWA